MNSSTSSITDSLYTDILLELLVKQEKERSAFKQLEEWKSFFSTSKTGNTFWETLKTILIEGSIQEGIQILNQGKEQLKTFTRYQFVPIIGTILLRNQPILLKLLYEIMEEEDVFSTPIPHLFHVFMWSLQSKSSSNINTATLTNTRSILQILYEQYGIIFRNSCAQYFLKEVPNISCFEYVYEKGQECDSKTMYLDSKDADYVLNKGWIEGIESIILKYKIKPSQDNAVLFFKSLKPEQKEYPEILKGIELLINNKIMNVEEKEVEEIKPPALKKTFQKYCLGMKNTNKNTSTIPSTPTYNKEDNEGRIISPYNYDGEPGVKEP